MSMAPADDAEACRTTYMRNKDALCTRCQLLSADDLHATRAGEDSLRQAPAATLHAMPNLVACQCICHEWRADIGAFQDALPIREVPGQLEALHSHLRMQQDHWSMQAGVT